MADRIYYCFCDSNCKFETMTKEQIFAAIAEATGNTPTEIDDAFITKLKEQNKGGTVTIWRGTVAEYNALVARGEKDENCIYIKTDEKPLDEINAKIAGMENEISSVEKELSRQGITVSHLAYKANDELNGCVIFDGVSLLDGDTVIDISASERGPVSDQYNGLMLGFVPYTDGAVKNYSVNWVFVPKIHTTLFNEKSITVMLNRYDFKSTGFKSVYINDDEIRGYAGNVGSGTTTSGITYDNGAWALRYVIGV